MSWEIREGHVLDRLAELPDESVHTVITSPPYWGLRDYGTAEWEGGEEDCDHDGTNAGTTTQRKGRSYQQGRPMGVTCRRCGARRVDSQIGLEPTPEEYVAHLVAVFRDVRRVLREDGTLWLNLGDTYNAYNGNRGDSMSLDQRRDEAGARPQIEGGAGLAAPSLKNKDLVGIPWRVAFALQADGWYLRSDVVWGKPNPMPESVADRPTKAHEYVFLLTKGPRYFYDADAIREEDGGVASGNGFDRPERLSGNLADGSPERWLPGRGRNKRSVWMITTRPFPEAHFATFPPELVEPMILAGSSPQVCGECGAPWRRLLERVDQGWDGSAYGERAVDATGGAISGGTAKSTLGSSGGKLTGQSRTVGWEPTCDHDAGPAEATVLDPFSGAATTGLVAQQRSRHYIGIELNPEYAELGRQRIRRWEANPSGYLTGAPEVADDQLGLELG